MIEPRKEGSLHEPLETGLFIYLKKIFFILRAAPVAHGNSQPRGQIRATAAGLCHSHSNTGSEPPLRPTSQLMAMPDP